MGKLNRRLAGLGISAVLGAATLLAPAAAAHAAPADSGCTARSDGKFDCNVWTYAPSYFVNNVATGGGLHAGVNYFYCQAKGSEYHLDSYQNNWWALTDDDNGNKSVWVNVVYLSGGSNDQPEPGLKTC
ncbi:hypothetical protein P3T36_005126 [Kitasatospora sp. MAP12-15]|uniref:hypothetical protein n=1 Tax=unclassified Kitasatospora TaxID=2633591 RepID=UPI00247519F4|nr:hypothetical protein [Kitasatospora sp. MAP12-44]MDH6109956.1 hypothetical protein [Kitasatospora sp. MAP12-44]